MGAVYRKTVTRPLPEGAELFTRDGQRFARWKPPSGRARVAPVSEGEGGALRILVRAGTWTAKYRDGQGRVVEAPTGCRDEGAGRAVLAELERRAELVRSGVVSPVEDRVSRHAGTALQEHVDAYLAHVRARGRSQTHLRDLRRQLTTVAAECAFRRLADLDREVLERWLDSRIDAGKSARTVNGYRVAWFGFGRWCARNHRLAENPFREIGSYSAETDRRRQRRALTEDEVTRLLDAARSRSLLAASTVRRGARRGELACVLQDSTRAKLEQEGAERAVCYLVALTTGLRRSELARLVVADLDLGGPRLCEIRPALSLRPEHEKSRRGAVLPLRRDVARELGETLAQRLALVQADRGERGAPLPVRLPPDEPIFHVPAPRTVNLDFAFAGISKRDERGRVVDFHSLRVTFGTNLSRSGASLRVAQSAMRHTDPKLTANVYTDPELLDVAGAVDALPALPLAAHESADERVAAGCESGSPEASALAPALAPTRGFSGPRQSLPVTSTGSGFARTAAPSASQVELMPASSHDLAQLLSGSGGRDRTADLRVMNPLL